MTATLILAAGLGTRLAPLTAWRPKPLVPIGDRPAVGHLVEQVRGLGGPIVLNAYHHASQVEAYAREAGLHVSREEELLGTAGGLRRAGALLGAGDVLVWNGDMIGELDVGALVAAHVQHAARGGVATLVVKRRDDTAGSVGLDEGGGVVRLRRESCAEGEVGTADFLGIYLVGEDVRRRLPEKGDVISEGLLPAMRAGGRVAAFVTEAPFVDVGTPRAYLDANLAWLRRRGVRSWVAGGVGVGVGVELDGVVAGEGARVEGAGMVEACVLWPGAVARAPIANAIVAVEGVVRV